MMHTPGPWILRRHVNGPIADIYAPHDRPDCLATTAFHGWTFAEMEANARLIAAAPDMLEALEGLLDCEAFSACTECEHRAERAIAKARGE